MLYYHKIDFSKRIDITSKEYDICHYWYFVDNGFKFEPYVCNGCHDILMMSINLNDIAALRIKGADYCCIINGISKSDAINLLKNSDLTKKRGVL